ncbi:quinohemoprotein amine dehydrogenase subunit alpha [Halomonas sp. MCCC 1A17488]|uniref:quinohemoprotein amine dehydrogenase subunit alpha n=1 Tax=unclassified Halomonas TaxID=2609666 RepID=UPI0018D20D5C|nr:quinohemoprotein amine dehydrogenase subunit alpha [Halomonas sp. SS10-MC5]MCE8017194.1 quinohemoprotein amine dehydrogenase subunit alpha [Halomonas sp. MCCC 1A17488]MCG3240527.1 quinohemoprotein amine dehydrogenase subunit alpha [Halomonas sp. MCCC 1A17488]QPP49616.1 quinohemoprotein amine dehydrogenase subunit alpha [Halomonas sp. SS10-MC5]
MIKHALSTGLCGLALLLPALAQASPGGEAIGRYCTACHQSQNGPQSWSRISQQRKTPEGWDMTVARMQIMHGLELPADARRDIIKYLADAQGLAPEESAPQRELIERRLNRIESFDHPSYQEMCARCHTGGRAQLQQRSLEEWEHLVHFHVGQFQTIEYQAMARDRDWFDIALNEIAPWLAETQGLESEAWSAWQQAEAPAPEGDWQLWGHWPGEGDFYADVSISGAEGEDAYSLTLAGAFTNGRPLSGEGRAIVYTGYEWRANLELNGRGFQQVLDLSGERPSGRIFDDRDEAFGMQVEMMPVAAAAPGLVASQPASLKAGERSRLVLLGQGLNEGEIELGEGVSVRDVIERSDHRLVLDVVADADLTPGWLSVRVGDRSHDRLLAGYRSVDRLEVSPALGVARVGNDKTPPVSGVFTALGYLGEGETSVPLGQVPVRWSVAPWDEIAERDEDTKYAGVLDAASGIFSPAGAGPNPQRQYNANSVGNLRVTASVVGQEEVQDEAQLIVTVQRWNNPPLR